MKKNINFTNYNNSNATIVTIGTFDGVHIGHQKIIKRLVDIAHKKHLNSVVLTFFPHPRMVLQNNNDIKLLNTIEERETILSDLGLDYLVVKTFTKEFANLSAEEFVKNILVDKLNAKHIIIGYDHRFGKGRSANIDDLKSFGKQYNFEVEEISVQDIEDVSVSSTKTYLGYNFYITGKVVKGKGLGRKIGFPTANIEIAEDYKLIPKNGVYVIKTSIENKLVYGMMNIGMNPTVNGTKKTIEAHFFNFNNDIYNQTLKIEFVARLRDEQKFESVELLKKQLKLDEKNAKVFI